MIVRARNAGPTHQPVTFRWKSLLRPQTPFSVDFAQIRASPGGRKLLCRSGLREVAIQNLNL